MFTPQNFEEGQQAAVGDCNNLLAKERWEHETPIFADIVLRNLPKNTKTILDYGCGVGRLAKEVLEKNRKVKVIGVDYSKEMLEEAKKYVLSDRFYPKLPEELNEKVDFAYAVYVFQHIPALDLRDAVKQIADSSDRLLLVNSVARMAVKGEGFEYDHPYKHGSDQGFVNVLDEVIKHYDKCKSAIPFKHIVEDSVMRKMFLEGDILHYGVLLTKQNKEGSYE